MRKDQLDDETHYAFWTGPGGFAVPKEGYKAHNAVKNTLRVRMIAADADADTSHWLIPPRATGVLLAVLDPETGEDTFKDDKLVTRWVGTAKDFVMTWDQFVAAVQPLIDKARREEERAQELNTLSDRVEDVIAAQLSLDRERVSVSIQEWRFRRGRDGQEGDLNEHIDIEIKFETIAELEAWLEPQTNST